jgi:hypothetical protein
MEKIKRKFEEHCNTPSDIYEHINTLYNYSKKCDHITEMGVRWVSSTWGLLYSNPKKIISYDILKHPAIDEVISLSDEYGINFTFIEEDVLKIEIEPTELLFIDTLHTYNQLLRELKLHSNKVSKYIILHDTITFGRKDETIYEHASDIIKEESEKEGLVTAVEDFLISDEGKNWEIFEVFENNNGLTVLKRKTI